MAGVKEIIDKLKDNASTVVDIPGKNGEIFRYNALFIKQEALALELLFPPNSWDKASLQEGVDCNLVIEQGGHLVNLTARLDAILNDRRLLLTARDSIDPEALRDYFRVVISTPIEASYVASITEKKAQSWKMSGTTIDLSGSGVLALFPGPPASTRSIQLSITVPGEEDKPIICLADVIRSYRIRKGRFQVAFHFAHITSKIRDRIISCCFQEQRCQLRGNIHV